MSIIRVGLVGVTPGGNTGNSGWARDLASAGWGYVAHLPALAALPDFEIRAVSSRSHVSAQTVADKFGIPHVFPDIATMARSPEVDLVVVTVRVPAHLELVEAALTAGKAVFCEWPLGNGLAEAERMATLARQKGVRCGVGLQARGAPSINYVRDLVADGFVGEVLSTSMIGAGMNWGPGMPSRNDYTLDKRNGATLLSIATGHALDALCYCLGEFSDITAVSGLRRNQVSFPDLSAALPATAEDQWAITGTLASGAVASVHYRGGTVHPPALLWEINGTRGDIRMSCDFGNVQVFQLSIEGGPAGEPMNRLPVPESYRTVPHLADPVLNVAQLYKCYAADYRDGGHRCPTFDDAVLRHRMLETVERAAVSGSRQNCRS